MDNQTTTRTSFFKKITYTDGIYPVLTIALTQNPNRFWAVPLIGILIKCLILIPIFIEIIFLSIWLLIVVVIINPLIMLLTGRYWSHAHQFSVGFFRLTVKAISFFYGLTDKYPGFDFSNHENLTLEIPLNQNPKKLFAIPVIGGLIRFILLIPYLVFENIIAQAAALGVFILAWAVVLFKGRYPEGIFELARDSIRVNTSAFAYLLGLSDRYPSFYISMAHDKIKLILIAIAIIFNGWSYSDRYTADNDRDTNNYKYQQELPLNLKVN